MSRKYTLGTVVASRTLRYKPREGDVKEVVVRLGLPVPDESSGDWVCPYHISGIYVRSKVRAVFGVDSMQALILALHALPVELQAEAAGNQGCFQDGDEGLGLDHACGVHLSLAKHDLAQ